MSQNFDGVTKKSYVVIIPAYNEEATIISCLDHIYAASLKAESYILVKIVVCINGCSDKTEQLVSTWNKAPLDVIHSKSGYLPAMNQLFKVAAKKYSDSMLVKTDGDGEVDPESFNVLFNQLEKHKKLIVVGGHPVPKASNSSNLYRKLIARIVSVRSRTPEAEITYADTTSYHKYASSDPIPELNGREEKLKVYFHGRLWCARSSTILPLLPLDVIGDDVYLPGWLFHHYGKESIRLDYRAKVSFMPNDSLSRHWKVYRRVFEDRSIVYSIPEFDEYVKSCPLKLDWGYILLRCSAKETMYFAAYSLIVAGEKLSYKWVKYQPNYWQYEKKEV